MINLDENEKIIAIFRKHSFYFNLQIVGLLLFTLIPIFIYPFFETLVLKNDSGFTYLFIFIYLIYLAILWVILFIKWTDYYLDIWVLTDKKLIDVEQKGLFSREISSMRLDKIQDVKMDVTGILNTILGIGTISIQTAGSDKEFIIRNAKNPKKVKELILSAHGKQIEEIKTVKIENPI